MMMKTIMLLTVLVLASVITTHAERLAGSPDPDTTKNGAKSSMGYKYNKQHHLKANGKPSKLYPVDIPKDTLKRKG